MIDHDSSDFRMPAISDWILDPEAVGAWLLFHPKNGECLGAVSVRPEMRDLAWPLKEVAHIKGVHVGTWWASYVMDLVLPRGVTKEQVLDGLLCDLIAHKNLDVGEQWQSAMKVLPEPPDTPSPD